MKIEKDLVEKLQSEGIYVSPFINNDRKERITESIKKRYENWYRYKEVRNDDGSVTMVEKPNWKDGLQSYIDWHMNPHPFRGFWYDATKVYIGYDYMLFTRPVNKSQVITEDFIRKAIEREKKKYSGYYGKFAQKMAEVCKNEMGVDKWSLSIYPTTYGIGLACLWQELNEDNYNLVKGVLDKYGIEYRNEFSDEHYAFRFIISKKMSNMEKFINY